jgi:uncharacterized protein with HEPN domain
MKLRSIALRLQDMIEAIGNLRLIIRDLPIAEFEADVKTRWSVERGLEIVSEASRHLDSALKTRHQEIPWRKIAGIGNILRHDYEAVSAPIIWSLTQNDLSELERVCRQELEILGKPTSET